MARMRSWAGATTLALAVVLPALPAWAFDLNGTWAGKITCRGIFDGERRTVASTPTLLVDDGASLQLAADGIHYAAVAYPDPTHPDKGEIAIIRCDTSSTRSGGEFGGEFGRLKVSTRSTKGSLSGTTFKAGVLLARSLYTCRWRFKRTTIERPPLDDCSAQPSPP
jgi:hypothetical protein